MQIKVLGLASGQESSFKFNPTDPNSTLLTELLQHGFTVAYSCFGKKVCKTCKLHLQYVNSRKEIERQENVLSCTLTLEQLRLLNPQEITVEISYL